MAVFQDGVQVHVPHRLVEAIHKGLLSVNSASKGHGMRLLSSVPDSIHTAAAR